MTAKKFSNALGGIAESYVDEAVTYTAKKRINPWLKWGIVAACLCLVVAGVFIHSHSSNKTYIYYYEADISKPHNGRVDRYYTDKTIIPDYGAVAAAYAESGQASSQYNALYRGSTKILYYPVFGEYLEATELYVFMFYKDDVLQGTKTLRIKEDITFEFERLGNGYQNDSDDDSSDLLSDKSCYNSAVQCFEYFPDFRLEGFIYNDEVGYPGIYPVGKDLDYEYVQYFLNGKLNDFDLIDKCKSIEDARTALDEYYAKKQAVISQIPVYSDTEISATKLDDDALSEMHSDAKMWLIAFAESSDDAKYHELRYDMDYAVAIPLLDSNGDGGKYVLYLIYDKNELIGEFVAKAQYNPEDEKQEPLFERMSLVKSDTLWYFDPIGESQYQKLVNEHVENKDGKLPQIVYFDGKDVIAE